MNNQRQLSPDAERSDAERAARREWQHRSRACGHSWLFNETTTVRRCTFCGRVQVWSSWLKDWASRAAAERSANINNETRRERDKLKG